MTTLTRLSQVRAFTPLSFKAHESLYFDNGIKTSAYIPKGKEILQIKTWIAGNIMNHVDQFKSKILDGVFDYIAEINPNTFKFGDRLRLSYQISQIYRDRSSSLYDYIETLPTSNLDLPMYWSNQESTSCIQLRNLMKDEYLLYRNSYDKIFDLHKESLSNQTFEEYVWTNLIVCQRSSIMQGQYHIVPIYDSFIHNFNENTTLLRDPDVIRIYSKQDIQEGEFLTRNIGNHSNYWYLLHFGHLVPNNPYHRVNFPPENLPEWSEITNKLGIASKVPLTKLENREGYSMSKLKSELLRRFSEIGLADCSFSHILPDIELETVFRIVFLNETDIQDLGISKYSDLFNLDFKKPITTRNQRNIEIFLFKASEMMKEILEKGFQGKHPLGREIENYDKEIVQRQLSFYRTRALNNP